MRPVYVLDVDGKDVTSIFQPILISLSVQERSGGEADTVELEIDDKDYSVALPSVGAKLRLSVGLGVPVSMGLFVVDHISGLGPRPTMRIKAKAADMTGSIRAPRNREWNAPTLQRIVSEIAGDHGLQPLLDPDLASVKYAYIAQTGESDLNLLTRLAKDLDAVVKPAGGKLIVARRGSGIGADGTRIPPVTLPTRRLSDWQWELKSRKRYKKATATWWDAGAGQLRKVTHGDGEPSIELRHRHSGPDEAQRAAKAAVEGPGRGSGKITINCATFIPEVTAGGEIILPDIKPELSGSWIASSVTHRLGAGLLTSITAERDNEGAQK